MAKLIGTAGHVDHGKTTLIQALTGIDADRLPEEKARGMTIDIGFAFIDLAGVGRVSIVDVPGHQKFLTNMLVGALGMDVGLLCVAADAGVMPQTREHLQILEVLPVETILVALTRADLADQDTRELAIAEVEELLSRTRFLGASIVPVSAHTGEGIEDLREALTAALSTPEPTDDKELWYLPIDRAFNVKGHGCVVTGTLPQGVVRVGDGAVIQPGDIAVRIRAIHSHDVATAVGEFGRRIALNLSGVKLEVIRRGMALGAPGAVFSTTIFDAKLRWVGEHRHGQRVRVSIGAEEAIGKLFLSDSEPEVAQIRLESEVAVALDQPLVVRRYSPPDLIAGGRVKVPVAKLRKRSEAVKLIEEASPEDALATAVGPGFQGTATEEVCRKLGKTPQELGDLFERLQASGVLVGFGGLWFQEAGFRDAVAKLGDALAQLHSEKPTQAYHPREVALQRAGLNWTGKPLDRILSHLDKEGTLRLNGTSIRLSDFTVQLTPRQKTLLDRVVEELNKSGVNVPPESEIAKAVSVPPQAVAEILKVGAEAGVVVNLGDGIHYSTMQLGKIQDRLREVVGQRMFSAAEVRDALGTTRKYIIPLLEYFDSVRFTQRTGDQRKILG